MGAGGKMGSTVCAAVDEAGDLELVARIDPQAGLESISALEKSGADVAVDFTHPSAVADNVEAALRGGVHAVVGTTGWGPSEVERFRALCEETKSHCLLAPNFAIGAVLMMRLAEVCAPHFERAEVIELHHDAKADAPSGTARLTVERMNAARERWPTRPESSELVEGTRGGLLEGIRVHSVRLPGLVAHHEVIFGTTGQTLSIRHDSTDRSSFLPGILLGIRRISEVPGLTVGLEHLLGL
jgi:4-hydroxy-tetrahydrodipicolinate reductase